MFCVDLLCFGLLCVALLCFAFLGLPYLKVKTLIGVAPVSLTPDFEVLEASGARKGDQGSPKKPPRSSRGALKRLPRGSLEVHWELLEVQKAPQATILETFIDFRASKNPPGGPQVTICRPCPRFRVSRRGTGELDFRLSRGWAGPRRHPGHARARTSFHYIYNWRVI